jgi:hypothetical protein
MVFGEVPNFEIIVTTIAKPEKRLNALGPIGSST